MLQNYGEDVAVALANIGDHGKINLIVAYDNSPTKRCAFLKSISKKLSREEETAYFMSEENFELAWRRVLSSPILDTKDRLGLKVFSAQTAEHLRILREDISDGSYYCGSPFCARIGETTSPKSLE